MSESPALAAPSPSLPVADAGAGREPTARELALERAGRVPIDSPDVSEALRRGLAKQIGLAHAVVLAQVSSSGRQIGQYPNGESEEMTALDATVVASFKGAFGEGTSITAFLNDSRRPLPVGSAALLVLRVTPNDSLFVAEARPVPGTDATLPPGLQALIDEVLL